MLGSKGVSRIAGALALAAILAGCGGLGVDLRSGGSGANTPNGVAITDATNTTLNPYPIEIRGHTFFVSHPQSGNVLNYGVEVPTTWNSSSTGSVALFEGDCTTAYGGEPTSSVCVRAIAAGGATVNATTSNGAVGSINVTVTI